ncbi:MAG: S4 domain-containing protein [Verrucomicrobiota bacterium]
MFERGTGKTAGHVFVRHVKALTVDKSDKLRGEMDCVRLDIWAWAVRLFRTRDDAASACKKDQVRVNQQRCRPSRLVRVGDLIEVQRGDLTKTLEVKALLRKRVGARMVDDFLIDRTPKEEYERAAAEARKRRESTPQRQAGKGRPTKKDRRHLDQLFSEGSLADEEFKAFVKSATRRR